MNGATSTIGIKLTLDGASQTESGIRRVTQSVDDMGGSAKAVSGFLTNMLGVAFGGATIGAYVSKLVQVQREFDVLNSSLVTVTGSSAQAEKEFAWIRQFASTTPYALAEVTQAFVKMRALGLDASKESLLSYANTASAMGKGLDQVIEAVADASSGEFERLRDFGIRASQQGDQVAFTFRGVTTTVKKNSDDIVAYLKRIGDVDFAGAVEERSKTLDAALSNLADSWDGLFRAASRGGIGNAIANDARSVATTLDVIGEAMENARKSGGGLARQLTDGLGVAIGRLSFGTVAATAETLNGTINFLTGNLFNLSTKLDLLPDNLRTTAEQAEIMGRKIKEAEAEFAALQERSKINPESIYFKSELANLSEYIASLRTARDEKQKLIGQFAGGGRGFTNPKTVGDLLKEEEKRLAAQREARDKLMEKLATPDEKLQTELARQRDALGQFFTPDVERRIRESFAKKGGTDKNKVTPQDLLGFDVAEIERNLKRYTDAYTNAQDIVSAAQAAGLIDDREYYEAQLGFINLNADARVRALQQERERLEMENTTGAERLRQLERVADIEAEISMVRQDAAAQTEILGIREDARLKRVKQAYEEAKVAAQAYLDTLLTQYTRDIDGFGRGDRGRRLAIGLNQIDDRYANQRESLANDRLRGDIKDEAEYQRRLDLINNYNELARAAYRKHYADLEREQANWLNGANDAIANYRDGAADVAGMTNELFTNAFQGMEDALVTFVTTGKLSFTDLANSIVADITRIIIKQQISNALGVAGGSGGSGALGLIGAGVSALFGTSGTAALASSMPGNSLDTFLKLNNNFGTGPSFDGGGYTGDAPRVGGVDGKGGFWALMHPQETVVDHARGQTAGMTVTNHFTISGPVDRRTEGQIAAAAHRGLSRWQRNL